MEEEESRKEARENYKKWVLFEEMSWRQKSRKVWLKEGDRNMSFFHRMTNAHRRRYQMVRVKINGTWIIDDSEIKEEVSRAFQLLLSTNGDWRPCISGLFFERLENLEVEGLEKPFTKEEVFGALSDFSRDKAPGLDGFSITFWQFLWDFVKNEVMDFFREFHEFGRFVQSLNATFLGLSPKKGVGGAGKALYKWLAKVLANRLKGC